MNDATTSIKNIIAVTLLLLLIWAILMIDINPKKEDLPPQSGNFVTIDKLKLSMYITRTMKDAEGKKTICFVQRNVTGNFFENCVWQESMDDLVESYKGYITNKSLYPDSALK